MHARGPRSNAQAIRRHFGAMAARPTDVSSVPRAQLVRIRSCVCHMSKQGWFALPSRLGAGRKGTGLSVLGNSNMPLGGLTSRDGSSRLACGWLGWPQGEGRAPYGPVRRVPLIRNQWWSRGRHVSLLEGRKPVLGSSLAGNARSPECGCEQKFLRRFGILPFSLAGWRLGCMAPEGPNGSRGWLFSENWGRGVKSWHHTSRSNHSLITTTSAIRPEKFQRTPTADHNP